MDWHILDKHGYGISKTETLVDHFLQGELDKFSNEFPDYVLDQLSSYDLGSSKSGSSSADITKSQKCIGNRKQAEYVYHAFTYFMCLIAECTGFKEVIFFRMLLMAL